MKSASRFTDCHQVCQQKWGVFLPTDLLTVMKSAARFTDCHQICWQKWRGISTCRFTDCHQIFLLADLLSPNLLPEMGGISTCRFTDCHQICLEIYCYQICQKNRRGISAVRFTDSPDLPMERGGYFCQ